MDRSAQKETILKFANYMFNLFNLKMRTKKDSILMKICAWFLDIFGIMSKKEFMTEYSTIMFGKIYICYELGNLNHVNFGSQMAMIGHECMHAHQKEKTSAIWYGIKYLLSKKWRAKCEIEAYVISIKVYHMITGKFLDIEGMAKRFKDYGMKNYVDDALKEFKTTVQNINVENHNPVETTIRRWIKND